MCGIAGYVGTRDLDADSVDLCLDALRQRGPDDAGFRRFEAGDGRCVWLLNRRLRIIDLDPRARQPLEHGGQWITYNGELYNYVELKRQLADSGTAFQTASDTEVLLATLVAGGIDALDGCEGMWAFAAFDPANRSLTLCRDRFGEKPLYLYRDQTGLYFASETRALRALVGHAFVPNHAQIRRYLVNGYKSLYKSGETFFEGVTELPAGSWLRIDADGRETKARYWTPRIAPDAAMSYADAVAGTRAHLERSVSLRLRADVPLAFCLSSGVDSNAIAAVASKVCGYRVHGFTVVDEDPRYDEGALARLAAGRLGIEHSEIALGTTGFLDDLRAVIRYHDAPVATISYFMHWQLMAAVAKAGYRVSVSGTGADEIFSGYYDHHLFYLHAVAGDPARLAEARAEWEAHVAPLVRNPFLQDPDRFLSNPGFRDHIYLDAHHFAKLLPQPWHESFSEQVFTAESVLRNRMMNELFVEAVPVILHEDDLNAMYHSIENRSPYLDRALFDFAASIPTRHLVKDGFAKAVLRDAVRDLVPAEIIDNRRKTGFNASIHSLLDASDPAVREQLLADSPIFEIVKRDAIPALLDASHLPNSQSKFLFYFVSAKMFLEEASAA